MCIPEEALQSAFRLNRRSCAARLNDVDSNTHHPPTSPISSPLRGDILDVSRDELKEHRGKSLSFEAFYDGMYTIAFNVHTFAEDDSDRFLCNSVLHTELECIFL
jgi:hypothetical protein